MEIKRLLILTLATFLITACGSTQKVLDSQVVAGQVLSQSKGEPVLTKTTYQLSLKNNIAVLERTNSFKQKVTNTHQKVERQLVESTSNETYIATPVCAVGALISLNNPSKCAGRFDSTEKKSRIIPGTIETYDYLEFDKVEPVVGESVQLAIDSNPIKVVKTNHYGRATLNVINLLNESAIHPRNLIKGQGLTISVFVKPKDYKTVKEKFHVKNSDIPLEYFDNKLKELKASMKDDNVTRYENCEFISQNSREIFECFYVRV